MDALVDMNAARLTFAKRAKEAAMRQRTREIANLEAYQCEDGRTVIVLGDVGEECIHAAFEMNGAAFAKARSEIQRGFQGSAEMALKAARITA